MVEAHEALRNLEDENAELERRLAAQNDELIAMRRQLAANATALSHLTTELDHALAKASHQRATPSELVHQRLKETEARLATAHRELKLVRAADAHKQHGLLELDARLTALLDQRDTALADKAAVDKALSVERTRTNDLEKTNDQLVAQIRKLEAKLRHTEEVADARVSDWMAERQRLREEAKRAVAAQAALQKQLTAQRARASHVSERLVMLQTSLRNAPPPESEMAPVALDRSRSASLATPLPSQSSPTITEVEADPTEADTAARLTAAREYTPSTVRRHGGAPRQMIEAAGLGDFVPYEHFAQLERELRQLRKAQPRSVASQQGWRPHPTSRSDPSPWAPRTCAPSGLSSPPSSPLPRDRPSPACTHAPTPATLPQRVGPLRELAPAPPKRFPVNWRR